MSAEMKGFLTTLELLTKDKVEPETVVEEDEIEETLTINEDGNVELLSELNQPTRWRWNPHVNPDSEGWEGRDAEQDEKGMDEFHADAARQRVRDRVASNMRDDDVPRTREEYYARKQKNPTRVVQDWPYVANQETGAIDPERTELAKAFRPPSSRNYKTFGHDDIEMVPAWDPKDGIGPVHTYAPTDPKVGSYTDEPGAKSTWDKLADVPDWFLRSLKDGDKSLSKWGADAVAGWKQLGKDTAKAIIPQGVQNYGKRIGKDYRQNVLNSITIEDANILLESWEIFKQEELNSLRRLSGLKESFDLPGDDVWAYSPTGKGTEARVVKIDDGFQVYVKGPKGWIPQGQPWATQEEAEADARSFFD